VPDTDLPEQALGFRVQRYGMTKHRDLFTPRQLVAIATFSELVNKARERILADARAAGVSDGDIGAAAYATAVTTYLAFVCDKFAPYGCSLVPWYTKEDRPQWLFGRQAISMVWDFAEVNPFSNIGGSGAKSVAIVADSIAPIKKWWRGVVTQIDASTGFLKK
jgi:putative DNA methylase